MKWPTNNRVLAGSVALTLVMGCVDYATGYELNFFAFYYIPVAIAAWRCGGKAGFYVAVLSGATWFASDWFSGFPYSSRYYEAWNTGMRLVSFLIIAHAVSRIRSLLQAERAKSQKLKTALSEVKTLKGLLPICAQCKKIRNDKGYWEQVEVYVQRHTDAQFSHGICEECGRKLYPEDADAIFGPARKKQDGDPSLEARWPVDSAKADPAETTGPFPDRNHPSVNRIDRGA